MNSGEFNRILGQWLEWNGTQKKASLVRGGRSTSTAPQSVALSSSESEERACGSERCAKIQEIAAKGTHSEKNEPQPTGSRNGNGISDWPENGTEQDRNDEIGSRRVPVFGDKVVLKSHPHPDPALPYLWFSVQVTPRSYSFGECGSSVNQVSWKARRLYTILPVAAEVILHCQYKFRISLLEDFIPSAKRMCFHWVTSASSRVEHEIASVWSSTISFKEAIAQGDTIASLKSVVFRMETMDAPPEPHLDDSFGTVKLGNWEENDGNGKR
ncbi:hypothetical protein B0H14DRAFT_2655405 [Mycena olivaceomarginata]|nr:hypothetical protein B0H14DRAFT_2655405 [Mycena olivaceomarginata]